MNEIECYSKLYGTLVYSVPHYKFRIGWKSYWKELGSYIFKMKKLRKKK